MRRWLAALGLFLGLFVVGAVAQDTLSLQVLRLLTRINSWTGVQSFNPGTLKIITGVPSVTANVIYGDGAGNLFYNGGLIAGAGGGVTPHNLLSTTHPDTSAAAVTRGAVVVGNATPAWATVPVGAVGTMLRSTGTDTLFSTDASGLTAIPAAQITGVAGAFNGAAITNLNASNLASGTVPLAQLSGITNAQIANAAAIAYSKLNLTTSLVNGDLTAGTILNSAINAAAGIAYTKLTLTGSVLFADWSLNACIAGQVPQINVGGTAWACRSLVQADVSGAGSVTSVGLALPAQFTVSGSPVTTSGTLTAALAAQAANIVWAGPTGGGAVAPTFRSLVNADFPLSGVGAGTYTKVTVNTAGLVTVGATLNYATDGTGILPLLQGGTGLGVASNHTTLISNGAAWLAQTVTDCPNGNLAFTQSTNLFSCVAGRRANTTLTAQQASLVVSNLVAAAAVGTYRVNVYTLVTQAATTSGSVTTTIGWNDGQTTQTGLTATPANTLGAYIQQSFYLRSAAAQNITFLTTYTSVGGVVLQYSLFITVEGLQ